MRKNYKEKAEYIRGSLPTTSDGSIGRDWVLSRKGRHLIFRNYIHFIGGAYMSIMLFMDLDDIEEWVVKLGKPNGTITEKMKKWAERFVNYAVEDALLENGIIG